MVSGMTVEEQDNLEYPRQHKNRQVKGTQLGKLSKDDAIGPKDTFLPLWNSILSWVVYERITPSEDPRINENVEYEAGFDDDLPDELIFKPREGQSMPYPSKSSVCPPVQQAALQVDENTPVAIISNVNKLIKNIWLMRILFAPIDIIAENFPVLQTVVIILELGIFLWVLYELSIIIDALCMAVKAVCAPMIAVGRFMNRIM